MWRQVVLPVIVVSVSWLTMSLLTTGYVLWLDASYERVFAENVASINAAGLLQEEIWHLQAELVAEAGRANDWAARLRDFDANTHRWLAELEASSTTPNEQRLAQELRQATAAYRQLLEEAIASHAALDERVLNQLFVVATQVSEKADHVRKVNDALVQSASDRRIRIRNVVLWGRSLASFCVSGVGIAVGWWTASRLQRTVAQIQVTLHDPALARPDKLGTVQVRGIDELSTLKQQVEVVVERLRNTGNELQAARREMVRAERLAAIGGLAAGVAHELRNPLTSVKLLLQHAASRGGDAVVPAPRMSLILDEIERMEATIQGLLDFSRPAQPQRRPHDLRDTVERALRLVEGRAEKQQVATHLDLGTAPVVVNGDPQQLHQVFVNLLINAIEAMPQGGRLDVRIRGSDEAVRVEFADTGEGIPDEVLPRLFEPFASSKERGTGLGLAVSRRIVAEHGGTLHVRPQQPRGTVVELTLPAMTEALQAT